VVLETEVKRPLDPVAIAAKNLSIVNKQLAVEDAPMPLTGIDNFLDHMLQWAQSKYGNDEFVMAKEEFFWKMGKVFPEDAFYEQRMTYFLDYFLLQRPLSKHDDSGVKSTLESYLNDPDQILSDESFSGFYHSVFLVQKNNLDTIVVKDLCTQDQITVTARQNESFKAIQRKEIFQGFLYRAEDKVYLSRGVIFHPSKCGRILRKNLKKKVASLDFDRLKEVCALARLQLKYLRHKNIDAKRIYSENDGLRF
jgi:hypothetical protein